MCVGAIGVGDDIGADGSIQGFDRISFLSRYHDPRDLRYSIYDCDESGRLMTGKTSTLSGSRILIIGGTSGFGKEVALQVARCGAKPCVIGKTESHVVQMRESFPDGVHASVTTLDATDSTQFESFLQSHGPFDHAVSMLGGAMGGGFIDNPVDDIVKAVNDKFLASLIISKALAPHMSQGGSITLTSGSGGHPYDASGAIVGNMSVDLLVRGLAVELAPGLRVNAIAPSWTPTGLWRGMDAEDLAQTERRVAMSVPLKRVATVTEVASAYVFAMECGFLTGQIIHVDGGVSALES